MKVTTKQRDALTAALKAKLACWDAETKLEEAIDADLPDEWLNDYAANFDDGPSAEATNADVRDLLKAAEPWQ